MNNILVSVLIPTRKRTQLVYRSVNSLLSLSSHPSNIEIIIAHDEDDNDSCTYFKDAEWTDLIKHYNAANQNLQCPCWGYKALNKYYTAMAQQAQGHWLIIWNDDALMQTHGWDKHLLENMDFIGMLHMPTVNYKPNLTLFPIIPKIWMDLFGQISQTQITDTWIQNICHEADAVKEIPVDVLHDRYDLTGNNFDQTYLDRKYNKKEFNHETMQQLRSEWAKKLRQFKEQNSSCEPRLLQT